MLAVLNVVIPVFFISFAGFLYGRGISTNIAEVNRINLDLFVPALLIYVLSEKLGSSTEAWNIMWSGIVVITGSGLVAWLVSHWFKIDFKTLAPPMMFNNAANMGFPLAVFAFGEAILPYAVVLFLVQSISMFTFGFAIYERRVSLRNLLKNPIIIGMAIGLFLYSFQLHLPSFLLPGLKLLSDVAIPLTLVTLGVKLAEANWTHWKDGLLGAALRPLSGLPFGLLAIYFIPMSDSLKPLILLFSVLPPAVLNAPLAERYQQEPEKVAAMVMVGNLLTVLYMPIVFYVLFRLF